MLELSHEVARQLSAAIENLQLLEEVLRQRRLLEDSFNSLVDLVLVIDNSPAHRPDERGAGGGARAAAA